MLWASRFSPGSPFLPILRDKRRASGKSCQVRYDLISPIYDLMIQVSGLENGSVHGLVLLTSSCRMAAGGGCTDEAKALR